jgi:hypothetical protein
MGGLHPTVGLGPDNKIFKILQGLSGTQANDAGWPQLEGKYISYPDSGRNGGPMEIHTRDMSKMSWPAGY